MKLLLFFEKLKEKRIADEKHSNVNQNDGAELHYAAKEKIYFNLCFNRFGLIQPNVHLITLDEEDLQYFENKYSKLIESEKEKELAQVNEKYNKIINL